MRVLKVVYLLYITKQQSAILTSCLKGKEILLQNLSYATENILYIHTDVYTKFG